MAPTEPTHPREAALERFLQKQIRAVGGVAFKLAPTHKGLPDRLVVMPTGRMYLVELKTDVGRLSPAQEVLHARLAKLSCPVVTLYGMAHIKAWIRDVSWSPPERTRGRPRKDAAATE